MVTYISKKTLIQRINHILKMKKCYLRKNRNCIKLFIGGSYYELIDKRNSITKVEGYIDIEKLGRRLKVLGKNECLRQKSIK
jgi:hypothetical protein